MNLSACVKKATIILLTVIMISACAGSKVKVGNLDAAKGKVFKIGIVKAAGSTLPTILPFTDSQIESKKKALEQINIEEVCAKLRKYYGLQIDSAVDRTVRTVREGIGGPASPRPGVSVNMKFIAESAYYGNLKYDETSTLWLMLGGNSSLTFGENFQNVIDVYYGMDSDSIGFFETDFHYAVKVVSSGESILEVRGAAATIRNPMNGPFIDNGALWAQYIKNAAHIDKSLERDLESSRK